MDFPTQPSSFFELLSSQLPNNENHTDLLTPAPAAHLGGSTSPAQGEDRRQRHKWSVPEDMVLISAWLNTSKDPIIGNDQKHGAFWKRIAEYYSASPKVANFAKRESSHCKQRWTKINEGVSRFVGSYLAASGLRASGMNEDDVLKATYEIYNNDYHSKFTLEHAWRELRNDQKWCTSTNKDIGSSKKRRMGEDGSFEASASLPSVNEAQARPPGVKAAKRKLKRDLAEGGNDVGEFQQMWEIREKEFAFKDKLGDKKLLESLIAKTEPLSEMEVALKNKLIADLLM